MKTEKLMNKCVLTPSCVEKTNSDPHNTLFVESLDFIILIS